MSLGSHEQISRREAAGHFVEQLAPGRQSLSASNGARVAFYEQPVVLRGNTHFPMPDPNNVAIADLVSTFLAEKKLD